MGVGPATTLGKIYAVWPHRVKIGSHCTVESNVRFKVDGIWHPSIAISIGDHVFIGHSTEFNATVSVTIGDNCLIASGCRFIDHDHGMDLRIVMANQPSLNASIQLEQNVWLGVNVIVLRGVSIGTGAVVGAGAVVTNSIPKNEIWAGVPARKIGCR